MGRKSREKQLRTRREEQRTKSRPPLKFLFTCVIALGVGAALVFGYGWGTSARVVEPADPTQVDTTVPLSTRGKSISGWHDMANIPKYAYKTPPPEGTPRPDVIVKPTNRDLGYVGSTDVVNLYYSVVNEGSEDLVVDSLVTSCGCTTAELSNNIIPPGHRADLKVRFDVGFHKTERGEQVVRIVWLKTNDPATPIAIARLSATVQ